MLYEVITLVPCGFIGARTCRIVPSLPPASIACRQISSECLLVITSYSIHYTKLYDCGAIIEFEDPRIEALQEQVARERGFQMTSHRLELFGICSDCSGK